MSQDTEPQGANNDDHTHVPRFMDTRDTYEEQGRWGGVTPEARMLAANPPLEVNRASIITIYVRRYIGGVVEVAGVKLSA